MMASTLPLAIASIIGFRDFGGHATRDGQRVRSSVIFRSGSPANATDSDREKLRERGIRLVWDLRSNNERVPQPFEPNVRWMPDYKFHDYHHSGGDIGAVARQFPASPTTSRELMVQSYSQFPAELAEPFRAMFRDIVEGAFPMPINCMAGKDRTGVAAALPLNLLRVDRATIMQDYLVSVGVADQVWKMLSADHPDFLAAGRESWDPLVRCHPSYLAAYFQTIDREYGSAARYLDRELGLGPSECAALRAGLLEAGA